MDAVAQLMPTVGPPQQIMDILTPPRSFMLISQVVQADHLRVSLAHTLFGRDESQADPERIPPHLLGANLKADAPLPKCFSAGA